MSNAPNILMFAIGTAGDVYPSIAVGRRLRDRGSNVLLVANSYFEPAAHRAGLDFLSSGSAEEYLETIENPDLWTFGKGYKILLAETVKLMRPTYQVIEERYQKGNTVVLAPSSAFGARLANEKLGVPFVSLHLQPIALRSLHDQPMFNVPRLLKGLLPSFRKFMLAGFDRWVLHPCVLPEMNSFRRELGLAPVARPFERWIHSPDLIIGMFPEWFAAPQPDWPDHVHLTGFPLYDEAEVQEIPSALNEFLDAGAPPIIFVTGSGMRLARGFFEASTQACQRMGRRGLLLTRFADQIPASLPDGIRHFEYVPFSRVLPRAAALVHHGGIGTMAQAFRAGVPQLVTPSNFDQPDNAARLRRLGAGDSIMLRRYTADRAAEKLQRLLASPSVVARCLKLKRNFDGVDAIGSTCELIESVVARQAAAAC